MRVLLAWEIGGNLGYVTKLVEIGRALARKRGKNRPDLVFALQNPAVINSFAEDLECQVVQAPFYPAQSAPAERGPALLYPDELRAWGYDNPKNLAGQIQAWRSLYDLAKPDILVTQQAPTALLAARGMNFKTLNFGTGYDLPPAAAPMPSMRYWENIDPPVLMGREEYVLRNINAALDDLGLPVIEKFSEILEVDMELLTVFEEMDHYPGRAALTKKKPKYIGPFYSTDTGENLSWSKKAKKRILAYINTGSPVFQATLRALAGLPDRYDIIVSAPGISDQIKAQIQKTNLRVLSGPVRLDRLLKNCDLGINHAGNAISSSFFVAGVPQLLLPGTLEQLMLARALGRTNTARGMIGEFGPAQISALMERLLKEEEFKKTAQGVAKKYKSFKPERLATDIADSVVKLAG